MSQARQGQGIWMLARWWFVNDLQDQGLIKVEFVSTHDNIADIGTKNVQGDVLDTHTSRLMIE